MKSINKDQFQDILPEPRGGISFYSYQNKYILIGGGNRSEQFNDIWTLEIVKKDHNTIFQWNKILPKEASLFTPRTSEASTLVEDSIFLFGGQSYFEEKMFSDMLMYNINSNDWVSIPKSPDGPTERNSCSLSYDKTTKLLYLYGGADQFGPKDDLYCFDIDSKKWRKIEIKGEHKPQPSEMHSAFIYYGKVGGLQNKKDKNMKVIEKPQKKEKIIDLNILTSEIETEENKESENVPPQEEIIPNSNEEKGYLILIGGRNKEELLDDILALDLKTYEWHKIGNLPSRMCAFGSSIYRDKIYIYGGTDGQMFINSLFYYNITEAKWYILTQKKSKQLMPKLAPFVTINTKDNMLLLFGGCSYENETNDLMIFSLDQENLKSSFKEFKF